MRFHEARGIGPETIAEIQAQVRHRLLSVLARRGVLEREDAEAMGTWDHGGGFSVAASVRIEADDRLGLERLLRYCARPAFALDRLREIDAERLVYESVKPGAGGSVSLMLTPLELIERLAALIPPPRRLAAEPPEAAIRWSGARWLLWVGCTQWRLAAFRS